MSDAMGGKFGAGFLSAGFSELASPYLNLGDRGLNTLAHALVGGVAAELGGGKFSNGAITAAFRYLYDDTARVYRETTLPKGNCCYDTQEEAGAAALGAVNGLSIAINDEIGGLIYKTKDGKYGYSDPVAGHGSGVNPYDSLPPDGVEVVGDYHTHGDYSVVDPATGKIVPTGDPNKDDFRSDEFSTQDLTGIGSDARSHTPEYKGYLGTPSGKFLEYDPARGTIREIN